VKAVFDSHWRQAARSAQPWAVRLLADQALQSVYDFCLYRLGRRRDLCEEVVQETMVQALRRLADYDPDRSGNQIFGWLTGLARNEIRRVLAREKAADTLGRMWQRIDQELLDVYARLDSQELADQVLQRRETQDMVNAAMSQLPPHYRLALEDKYVRGLSMQQMALTQQTTPKAVESLLTRARAAFRAAFLALARNLSLSDFGLATE